MLNKKICEVVGFSVETAKSIEEKLKEIIHNYISVFFDKHLDQIIVCTIYIIQAFKKEKTVDKMFNHIIACYHKAKPEDSDQIYKSIFSNVKHSTKIYDIIVFYNKVFMHLFSENLKYTLNEDKEDNIERSSKKRRTDSSTEHILTQKKLTFYDDSAYDKTYVIYDSLKSSNSTGINTPIKSVYGCTTPDLTKTPRTTKLRSYISEILSVKDETFSLVISPRKQSTGPNIFKEKALSQHMGKARNLPSSLPKTDILSSSNKMDIIDEETEGIIPKGLNFGNEEVGEPSRRKESSEQGTPEFIKFK